MWILKGFKKWFSDLQDLSTFIVYLSLTFSTCTPTQACLAFQNCIFHSRSAYRQFIDELVVKPGSKKYDSNRTDVTMEDHVRDHVNKRKAKPY